MSKEIIKDVRRVLSTLSVVAPFSYPILTMPIIIKNDLLEYAGTNGVTFFINSEKWKDLNFKQKMFVTMHEWLHVALQHAIRMRGKKERIWNTACDFAINDIIINDLSNNFQAPKDILYNKLYTNMTAEQIYKLLINNNDYKGDYGKDLLSTPSNCNNQKLIDNIIKAAVRSKGMKKGVLPGRYEEFINVLKKTNIPWERILFRFAKKSLKNKLERNPFKPDPKYLPFDIIVPKEDNKKQSKLVFIIDTSASMKKEEFEYACGNLQKLGTLVDEITIITSDVKVHEVIKVKKIKKVLKDKKIKFKGRGGTDMRKAFEVAEKLNPDLIILFSDMFLGKWPNKPKRAQTIFLATKDSSITKSPYGAFIKIKK